MMRFFLKTRRKKCRGLAILLSDFGYLGHVTWEIIAFGTSHLIPSLSGPYLDICSFFEENVCFQTIIFLSITSSVQSIIHIHYMWRSHHGVGHSFPYNQFCALNHC